MAPRRRFALPSQRYNLETLRARPLQELSGAFGDMGTLLPLLVALTLTNSISVRSTLVFSGIANILTGLFFSVPLPVQPMKAIAAVAIARNFSRDETASAGLLVAGVIGVCSLTGLLNWLGRVCPIPVVKGIQVGAGLQLIITAGESLLRPLGWRGRGWQDNWWWALAAFLGLLITTAPRDAATATSLTSSTNRRRARSCLFPYALVTFLVGIVLAIIALNTRDNKYRWRPVSGWHPRARVPTPEAFRIGAIDAGLGQIPLTALNSIIAVTHLSAELLPDVSAPSPLSLGGSIALFNLVGCFFQAMPICHGSGGLAAQYRFGARSGASVVMLGALKLVLGLIFDGTAITAHLRWFPKSILGVLVLAAGVELTRVGETLNSSAKDLWDAENGTAWEPDLDERRARWTIMLVTVAGLLAFKNDAVGFIAGLLAHFFLQVPHWWENRSRGSGSVSGFFARVRGRRRSGLTDERTGLLAEAR